MSQLEYAWCVAIIEKIINDHCEKLRSEAEQLEGFEARKAATETIHGIKLAFQRVRNG
jgi:hypothetical protein